VNLGQYKENVVIPALSLLDPEIPFSNTAVNLILLTALQESNLTYLKQIGGGGALGLCQMEPSTEDSLWQHYINRKPALKKKMVTLVLKDIDRKLNLKTNLIYQVAMARIKYFPDSQALPDLSDVEGMSKYYKRIYNTYKGKADIESVEAIYKYRILGL